MRQTILYLIFLLFSFYVYGAKYDHITQEEVVAAKAKIKEFQENSQITGICGVFANKSATLVGKKLRAEEQLRNDFQEFQDTRKLNLHDISWRVLEKKIKSISSPKYEEDHISSKVGRFAKFRNEVIDDDALIKEMEDYLGYNKMAALENQIFEWNKKAELYASMENFLHDIFLLKYLKIEPFSSSLNNSDLKNTLYYNFDRTELPQCLSEQLLIGKEEFSNMAEKLRDFLHRYDRFDIQKEFQGREEALQYIKVLLGIYMPGRESDIHRDLLIMVFYASVKDKEREERHIIAKKIEDIYKASPVTDREQPSVVG